MFADILIKDLFKYLNFLINCFVLSWMDLLDKKKNGTRKLRVSVNHENIVYLCKIIIKKNCDGKTFSPQIRLWLN